jgi:thiamine pyrophosphokinase
MTLAPEAGSQRLRDVIRKNITEEQILNAVLTLYENGWSKLKFYFIVGLPAETQEDIDEMVKLFEKIRFQTKQLKHEKGLKHGLDWTCTLSIFVPKPFTPFQWAGQMNLDEITKRIHYLKDKNFPLDKLDFISGDFDSHEGSDENIYHEKFIHTPDQDFTDFQKALDILKNHGVQKVDVYGGSGGEQDHFLGNLHVAFLFKNEMEITFFDEFSRYFFISKNFKIHEVEGKMISLLPFPFVEKISTNGLKWELFNEELSLTKRVGTRNFARENTVEITYENGDLLIFIGN